MLEYLLSIRIRDVHSLYGMNGFPEMPMTLLFVKWHIRSKNDMFRAKKGETTHQGGGTSVEGRVIVEHLEILDRAFGELLNTLPFPLQTILLCQVIPASNPLFKEGDHTAAVMGDQFKAGILVEYPAKKLNGSSLRPFHRAIRISRGCHIWSAPPMHNQSLSDPDAGGSRWEDHRQPFFHREA